MGVRAATLTDPSWTYKLFKSANVLHAELPVILNAWLPDLPDLPDLKSNFFDFPFWSSFVIRHSWSRLRCLVLSENPIRSADVLEARIGRLQHLWKPRAGAPDFSRGPNLGFHFGSWHICVPTMAQSTNDNKHTPADAIQKQGRCHAMPCNAMRCHAKEGTCNILTYPNSATKVSEWTPWLGDVQVRGKLCMPCATHSDARWHGSTGGCIGHFHRRQWPSWNRCMMCTMIFIFVFLLYQMLFLFSFFIFFYSSNKYLSIFIFLIILIHNL